MSRKQKLELLSVIHDLPFSEELDFVRGHVLDGNSHNICGSFMFKGSKYFIKYYVGQKERQKNNAYNEILASYIVSKNLSKINRKYGDNRTYIDIINPIFGLTNILNGIGKIVYPYIEDINVGKYNHPLMITQSTRIMKILDGIGSDMYKKHVTDVHPLNTHVKLKNRILYISLFDLISNLNTRKFHDYFAHERYKK